MKKIIILFAIIFLFADESNLSFSKISNIPNITDNNISVEEITLESHFISLQPKLKLALIMDKKVFFKYIPSIVNSINSYLINKGIKYNIEVFGTDTNISNLINKGFKNIFIYSTDKNYIKNLSSYNNASFFIPIYNKNDIDINNTNFYFGGINYKQQIKNFIDYMDTNQAIAINSNTLLSKKLLMLEKEYNLSLIEYNFPNIYYQELNQSYIFLNIDAGKSAQVLSNITAKNLESKLIFASQIDYNPLLIEISQPQDIQKLLIANSILYVPKEIEDTNLNLQTDIKFNWLNYSTNILLNKIYNKITQNDAFFMNDFNIYIFNNEINYKTKLYQIINGAFKQIEN